MGWRIESDLVKERPFFDYIVSVISSDGGKKSRWTAGGNDAWEVKCPTCGCDRAVLTTDIKTKNDYVFLCPNKVHCSKRKMYLRELIDMFCNKETIDAYRMIRRSKTHYREDGGLPIKYRKTKNIKS